MFKLIVSVVGLFVIFAFSSPVYAFNLFVTSPSTGVAIHGFDPVAYFDKHEAIMGRDEFEVEWGNTYWKFENAANKERFLEAPRAFIPQYNGYGAYSVTQSKLTEGNPHIWVIYDNKLLFFYSKKARNEWIKSPVRFAQLGEKRWKQLRLKLSR